MSRQERDESAIDPVRGGESHSRLSERATLPTTTKAAQTGGPRVLVGLLQGFLQPYAMVGLDSGGRDSNPRPSGYEVQDGGSGGVKLPQFARDLWGPRGLVALKLEPHWNHGTSRGRAPCGRRFSREAGSEPVALRDQPPLTRSGCWCLRLTLGTPLNAYNSAER